MGRLAPGEPPLKADRSASDLLRARRTGRTGHIGRCTGGRSFAGHCRWSRSAYVPGHPPDLALQGPRRAYQQVRLSPVRSGDNALILTVGLSGALTAPLGSAERKSGVDRFRASELSHGGGVSGFPGCDEGRCSCLVHVCPRGRCRDRFRGSPRLAATGTTPGDEDRGQRHQGCSPPTHGTSMHSAPAVRAWGIARLPISNAGYGSIVVVAGLVGSYPSAAITIGGYHTLRLARSRGSRTAPLKGTLHSVMTAPTWTMSSRPASGGRRRRALRRFRFLL
jgi:hypothetical protein